MLTVVAVSITVVVIIASSTSIIVVVVYHLSLVTASRIDRRAGGPRQLLLRNAKTSK